MYANEDTGKDDIEKDDSILCKTYTGDSTDSSENTYYID